MRGRRIAFVDRDGTIIVERNYLSDPQGVELIPGAAPALRRLAGAGWALVLVSNQSGIARGYFTDSQFRAVQQRVAELLAAEKVHLDAVYYCPHHPDFTGPCDCRKPGTALFRQAARELGLPLEGAAMIGDRLGDVLPALELGGRGILVRTGYGSREAQFAPAGIRVAADLAAAADLLLHDDAQDKAHGPSPDRS
jgi:D-glycero-D-manno-heptose 1,7-bisphosphate phosphatase